MRKAIRSELRMLRELTYEYLFEKTCCLCKQPLLQLTKTYTRLGDRCAPPIKDQITIHHADGNHNNNKPVNRKKVHVLCHKKYHAKLMKRAGGKFKVTNGSTAEKLARRLAKAKAKISAGSQQKKGGK
jgi:hypothetical protein